MKGLNKKANTLNTSPQYLAVTQYAEGFYLSIQQKSHTH